ncbi:unnamed protein product, partial [Rotaria sp. Silwood2]
SFNVFCIRTVVESKHIENLSNGIEQLSVCFKNSLACPDIILIIPIWKINFSLTKRIANPFAVSEPSLFFS